jgi:hypothetical protein
LGDLIRIWNRSATGPGVEFFQKSSISENQIGPAKNKVEKSGNFLAAD